jgi:hypothetical protein
MEKNIILDILIKQIHETNEMAGEVVNRLANLEVDLLNAKNKK